VAPKYGSPQQRTRRQSNYNVFTAFAPIKPTPQNVTYSSLPQQTPLSYQANPSTTFYQVDPPTSFYKAPSSNSSYTTPPSVPSYTTAATYEAPPRVIKRQFGYVCKIIVSRSYCLIGTQCDQFGNPLKKNRCALNGTFNSFTFVFRKW
jgi:hypothetical protein